MKKYLALMIALLILMGLVGCGDKSAEAPELLEPVDVKLDVAEVQRGEIYRVSTYQAEVVPYVEELYFQTDGLLEEIYVLPGDTVQKGDVLAVLDKESLLEQIENLEEDISNISKRGTLSERVININIAIAREELAILRENGESAQICKAKELEIQKLETELKQAKELRSLELQQKQENLNKLQQRVAYNEIIAPFDGSVVYVSEVRPGDAIKEYDPVICIADDQQMYLLTEFIDEKNIAAAYKVFAKIQDKEYDISYIPFDKSEIIEMALSGRTLKTQFSIDTNDGSVKNGQFAAIVRWDSYKENVLTLPVNALHQDESGWYVYKLEDDRRVRHDVTVGLVSDTEAEIVEGLVEGDVVYVKD